MLKWIHHLFNPHCPDCAHEKECPTCETLRQLLESEKYEKKQLLDSILEANRPNIEAAQPKREMEDVKPKFIPWRVRQNMLEQEDRVKARLIADKAREMSQVKVSTETLEKELDIQGEANGSLSTAQS